MKAENLIGFLEKDVPQDGHSIFAPFWLLEADYPCTLKDAEGYLEAALEVYRDKNSSFTKGEILNAIRYYNQFRDDEIFREKCCHLFMDEANKTYEDRLRDDED